MIKDILFNTPSPISMPSATRVDMMTIDIVAMGSAPIAVDNYFAAEVYVSTIAKDPFPVDPNGHETAEAYGCLMVYVGTLTVQGTTQFVNPSGPVLSSQVPTILFSVVSNKLVIQIDGGGENPKSYAVTGSVRIRTTDL